MLFASRLSSPNVLCCNCSILIIALCGHHLRHMLSALQRHRMQATREYVSMLVCCGRWPREKLLAPAVSNFGAHSVLLFHVRAPKWRRRASCCCIWAAVARSVCKSQRLMVCMREHIHVIHCGMRMSIHRTCVWLYQGRTKKGDVFRKFEI